MLLIKKSIFLLFLFFFEDWYQKSTKIIFNKSFYYLHFCSPILFKQCIFIFFIFSLLSYYLIFIKVHIQIYQGAQSYLKFEIFWFFAI